VGATTCGESGTTTVTTQFPTPANFVANPLPWLVYVYFEAIYSTVMNSEDLTPTISWLISTFFLSLMASTTQYGILCHRYISDPQCTELRGGAHQQRQQHQRFEEFDSHLLHSRQLHDTCLDLRRDGGDEGDGQRAGGRDGHQHQRLAEQRAGASGRDDPVQRDGARSVQQRDQQPRADVVGAAERREHRCQRSVHRAGGQSGA